MNSENSITVPNHSPVALSIGDFLSSGTRAEGRVIVCVGDSITQGQISANWVNLLQKKHRGSGLNFVNAGVNGNLAWNVLQRLDKVIAANPDIITLLIGTNDILATTSAAQEKSMRKQQGLPADAKIDLSWYKANLNEILDRLQAETHATIVMFEIPILGEDPDSETNDKVRSYNSALHGVAEDRGIQVLPLFERLAGLIPAGHRAPPFKLSVRMMIFAGLQHSMLLRSWDRVAQANGLTLLIDHVHFSDRAASTVVELFEGFFQSRSGGSDMTDLEP